MTEKKADKRKILFILSRKRVLFPLVGCFLMLLFFFISSLLIHDDNSFFDNDKNKEAKPLDVDKEIQDLIERAKRNKEEDSGEELELEFKGSKNLPKAQQIDLKKLKEQLKKSGAVKKSDKSKNDEVKIAKVNGAGPADSGEKADSAPFDKIQIVDDKDIKDKKEGKLSKAQLKQIKDELVKELQEYLKKKNNNDYKNNTENSINDKKPKANGNTLLDDANDSINPAVKSADTSDVNLKVAGKKVNTDDKNKPLTKKNTKANSATESLKKDSVKTPDSKESENESIVDDKDVSEALKDTKDGKTVPTKDTESKSSNDLFSSQSDDAKDKFGASNDVNTKDKSDYKANGDERVQGIDHNSTDDTDALTSDETLAAKDGDADDNSSADDNSDSKKPSKKKKVVIDFDKLNEDDSSKLSEWSEKNFNLKTENTKSAPEKKDEETALPANASLDILYEALFNSDPEEKSSEENNSSDE